MCIFYHFQDIISYFSKKLSYRNRLVTERRMDGCMQSQSIYHATIASRGKMKRKEIIVASFIIKKLLQLSPCSVILVRYMTGPYVHPSVWHKPILYKNG